MVQTGDLVDGRYRVMELLARSSMSSVFLVKNEKVNKLWVLKEIPDAGNGNHNAGCCHEIAMLKKLHHPGLPDIVDVIETEESVCIIMDYLEGETLEEYRRRRGFCTEAEVLDWGIQICGILRYLHEQEIPVIHRDLKPSNLILQDGRIALIDLGIAREWRPEAGCDTDWLGTAGFAAPEQYQRQMQSDERSDLFSLGVTMFYLLSGVHPLQVTGQRFDLKQTGCVVSPGLAKVIQKCTRRNPARRYQSGRELEEVLIQCRRLQKEDSFGVGRKRPDSRHGGPWSGSLLRALLTLLIFSGALSLWLIPFVCLYGVEACIQAVRDVVFSEFHLLWRGGRWVVLFLKSHPF